MKKIFIIKLFFSSVLLHSQIQISGHLKDNDTKNALSFVNIGIKNTKTGTISSDLGYFSLLIAEQNLNDTLTFSLVGYHELNISINKIISFKQHSFNLSAKTVNLEDVIVSAQKLAENKYGIKKIKPTLHITDGSISQNDIFEIAQVIKLNPSSSKITSVNLLINESTADSGIFRVNFYGFDGYKPTKRIIETTILQKQCVKPGWLKFDLNNYNVYLNGQITVAIEFIPYRASKSISYEVKLGGNSRSYVKTNSLGEWNTPPHHYRVYVTVLETDAKKANEEDNEEPELVATKRLFSKQVADTFSIFINLPKSYNKTDRRKYPTLFLLDANVYYDILTNSITQLNKNKHLREPILVGIGYKDFMQADSLRQRDYTYPEALKEDSFSISGGADRFFTFITQELIPFLDKHYKTDTTNRSLMGHSLGGYFSLFALQNESRNKTHFFKNYVSASPSLDYHNRYIISQFKNLHVSNHNQQTLLITTGGLEDGEDGGLNFNYLLNVLLSSEFKHIRVEKMILPKTDHMATPVPTFEKGLELIMKQ
jgi:predicted alpha/beta superfamily hydrolase